MRLRCLGGFDAEGGRVELIARRLVLALPLTVLVAAQAPVRLRASMRLSYLGIGPVRIGMTEAQLRRALAGRLTSDESAHSGTSCYYLTPEAKEIGFMMLRSRCVRIDVFQAPWQTVSGAGVGSAETQVRRLYGNQVRVETHKYDPNGKYLIVAPTDPKYKGYELLFETNGKSVTRFRAGLAEAVGLVEGCS